MSFRADPATLRRQIKRLERALSNCDSSLARGPIEDELTERRVQLRRHYQHVATL